MSGLLTHCKLVNSIRRLLPLPRRVSLQLFFVAFASYDSHEPRPTGHSILSVCDQNFIFSQGLERLDDALSSGGKKSLRWSNEGWLTKARKGLIDNILTVIKLKRRGRI